jgi:hypothetical protein
MGDAPNESEGGDSRMMGGGSDNERVDAFRVYGLWFMV